MSLLNDVLRDLDRTKAAEASAAPGVVEATVLKPKKNAWLLPSLAATAGLYFCIVELNVLGLMPDTRSAVVEVSPPAALNSQWLARVEELKAQKAAEEARNAAAAQATAVDEATNAPVVSSTGVGLSSPMSELPPPTGPELGNKNLAGASSATQTLLERAALAQDQNQISQALQIYRSVLLLEPTNTQAQEAIEGIEKLQQKPQVNPKEVAAIPSPAAATNRAPLPKVAQSVAQQDELLAQRVQATDWRRWEQDAIKWLSEGARFEQTALALTERYARSAAIGNLLRVGELLANRGSNLHQLPEAWSDWLLQQQPAAVERLQRVRYQGAAEQMRLRLIGGWLQHLQQHDDAAEAYRALIQFHNAKPTDWLGLAVALDAQHQRSEALEAYRRASLGSHSEAKVSAFIAQRIRELSSLAPQG